MKKTVLIFITTMLLTACSSDSNPEDGLPKETQTGANTFGCLIDGKLYKPRCEKPSIVFPQSALMVWGIPGSEFANEIEIRDLKSTHYFNMILHLQNVKISKATNYQIDESNGENSIDGLENNYVNCILFDSEVNQYKMYVSYHNSGNVTITKYTLGDNISQTTPIISGTFSGRLHNINNPNDEIEIINGRFDINSLTCIYKEFP